MTESNSSNCSKEANYLNSKKELQFRIGIKTGISLLASASRDGAKDLGFRTFARPPQRVDTDVYIPKNPFG